LNLINRIRPSKEYHLFRKLNVNDSITAVFYLLAAEHYIPRVITYNLNGIEINEIDLLTTNVFNDDQGLVSFFTVSQTTITQTDSIKKFKINPQGFREMVEKIDVQSIAYTIQPDGRIIKK
jgi:hypothetical protein